MAEKNQTSGGIIKFMTENTNYLIFGLALISTLVSFSFSEILHWAPCILCWYQRILMYPIVIISAVGIIRKDLNLPYYIISLSLVGVVIALYHSLLQWGIIPEQLAPCQIGTSCKVRHTAWFGFITIPFMSLVSFTFISLLAAFKIKTQN